MSGSESGGGAGDREVAYRLFAAEYEDADFSYSESDEERAPNYVVTPTGARANRVFVVGVLTETEQVNDDVLRARIVDPTGAFVVYAGQYQPDELAFLERADPPSFVAVTGKARTFQPDDSDLVYTSIRPESINEVTAETRDRWTVGTAEQTLARVATVADALSRDERGDELRAALAEDGVDEGLAAGIALAIDHYGTTPTYLDGVRELALDAARVVAGEREEVGKLTVAPDDEGATTVADLLALDADRGLTSGVASEPSDASTVPSETATSTDEQTGEPEPETAAGASSAAETEAASATGSETDETETAGAGETTATGTTETEPTTDDQAEPTTEPVGDEELGDFEPGEFELDDDEREEIESEYGTEFSTGTEVDEPGEADIETPDQEPEDEPVTETESESGPAGSGETDATTETPAESEPGSEPADVQSEPTTEGSDGETAADTGAAADAEPAEPADDVDLADAVMEVMEELNGDDGAPREDVIDRVTEAYGVEPEAVEDAIQDALMDGRCYEPDETTLKPI